MPKTSETTASDGKPAEGTQIDSATSERPPLPDPATMTKLHETLPEALPRASTEPGGSAANGGAVSATTPGTLPSDPTQATDPGAAKPGTPGID